MTSEGRALAVWAFGIGVSQAARLGRCPVRRKLRRSDMFIVYASRENQAPLGAACANDALSHDHMPLLTELEKTLSDRAFL